MPATYEKLVFKAQALLGEALKELDKAKTKTRQVGVESKKAGVSGKKGFGMLGQSIKSFLGPLGMATVGIGTIIMTMKKAIKTFTDYTVKVDKAVKITGVSVDTFQKLAYAAEQEHASMETLQFSLQRIAYTMKMAEEGSKMQRDALEQIGIKTRDANGQMRKSEEVLLEIADRFKNMKNETEKSALAMQLFGRRGQEMIPFLNMGKDGIEKLGNEAEKLGIVLEDKAIKEGKAFSDFITE